MGSRSLGAGCVAFFEPLEERLLLSNPPVVEQFIINKGSPQRSYIKTLEAKFSRDVGASLGVSDLAIVDAMTGAPIDISSLATFSWDPNTYTGTWSLPAYVTGSVPVFVNGYYSPSLIASGITDGEHTLDGNGDGVEGDNYVAAFHRLGGDANGDEYCDVGDLGILGDTYGTSGDWWSHAMRADFNCDGWVDIGDLGILGFNYANYLNSVAVSGPREVTEGSDYVLSLVTNRPQVDPVVGWTVEWGDGQVSQIAGDPDSVTHRYDGPGLYNIHAVATTQFATNIPIDFALDPGFGNAGKVITCFPNVYITSYDTALCSDGKILVVGTWQPTGMSGSPFVARYNADGTLDSTFGGQNGDQAGFVRMRYGDGSIVTGLAYSVAVNPTDGSFFVGGLGSVPGYSGDFLLAKYTSNGLLVDEFGNDGLVLTDFFGLSDRIYDLALYGGKIVAAGSATRPTEEDGPQVIMALAKYDACTGLLDTSFGTSGKRVDSFTPIDENSWDCQFNALAIHGGRIIAVGTADSWIYERAAVAAYDFDDGSSDESFDGPNVQNPGNGLFRINLGSGTATAANGIAIQPDDGKIVVVGKDNHNSRDYFLVARLQTDGSWDTTFGDQSHPGYTTTLVGFGSTAYTVALHENNSILVAGDYMNSSRREFLVAGYASDGELCSSLIYDGFMPIQFGIFSDTARGYLIDPDGRVVLAGTDGGAIVMARIGAVAVVPLLAPEEALAWVNEDMGVYLVWQESTGATAYDIYRATSMEALQSDFEEALPYATDVAVTFFIDARENFSAWGEYYYGVVAKNDLCQSDGFIHAMTIVPEELPGAPLNLDLTLGTDAEGRQTITLDWDPPANATAGVAYSIYRGTAPSDVQPYVLGVEDTSYTDNALEDGTTYYYQVAAAYDAAEGTSCSLDSQITIPPVPPRVRACCEGGSVTVQWGASTGAASYKLYRGSSLLDTVTNPNQLYYCDSSLQGNTTYEYKVQAANAAGQSGISEGASVTTPPAPSLTAPPAPSNVTFCVSPHGERHISWTPVISELVSTTGYKVYRGETCIATLQNPGYDLYVDEEDLTYLPSYSVAAYNAYGETATAAVLTTLDESSYFPAGCGFYAQKDTWWTDRGSSSERTADLSGSGFEVGLDRDLWLADPENDPPGYQHGGSDVVSIPLYACPERGDITVSYDLNSNDVWGQYVNGSTGPGGYDDIFYVTVTYEPWSYSTYSLTLSENRDLLEDPYREDLFAYKWSWHGSWPDEEEPGTLSSTTGTLTLEDLPSTRMLYLNIAMELVYSLQWASWGTFAVSGTPVTDHWIDFDVDSDNTSWPAPPYTGASTPAGTGAEDAVETTAPGAYIIVNDDDDDNDGIPDFADGYDWDKDAAFAYDDDPVQYEDDLIGARLTLESMTADGPVTTTDPWDSTSITISYDGSHPDYVTRSGSGTLDSPFVYTPAAGMLRLWKGRTYIAPGSYTRAQLDAISGAYTVEAVRPSSSLGDLSITFTAGGKSEVVVFTALKADVDVDSDNDGAVQTNPGWREEQMESFDGSTSLSYDQGFVRPGKMLDWDSGDKYDIDSDGIPDFADGINWDCLPDDPVAGKTDDGLAVWDEDGTSTDVPRYFVPVVVTLPVGDVTKMRLKLEYPSSDPAAVYLDQDGQYCLPTGGDLRLWTRPTGASDDNSRTWRPFYSRNDTLRPTDATLGFYVPPTASASAAQYAWYDWQALQLLGFSDTVRQVTLYAEQVQAGPPPNLDAINVKVDSGGPPGATGPAAKDAATTSPAIVADLTAFRPQSPGFNRNVAAKYMHCITVPADKEESPGAGIRNNGDDDDGDSITDYIDVNGVANEDDLIEVTVSVTPNLPPGYECILKRNDNALHVWTTRTRNAGTGITFGDNQEASILPEQIQSTIWIEWASSNHGEADLELIVRKTGSPQEVLASDKLHFYTFHSMVVVIGGETTPLVLEALYRGYPAPGYPNPPVGAGMWKSAGQLYEDGYDVHMFEESQVAMWYTGTAYGVVCNAIRGQGVTNVAIYGYSHGGGSTFFLSRAIYETYKNSSTVTIAFTGYVDAVRNESDTDCAPEQRYPIGSEYHINYYQHATLQGTRIKTSVMSVVNVDVESVVDVEAKCPSWLATDIGTGNTHRNIDDNASLLKDLKNRLKAKVPQR